jgi:hypothetical protein
MTMTDQKKQPKQPTQQPTKQPVKTTPPNKQPVKQHTTGEEVLEKDYDLKDHEYWN